MITVQKSQSILFDTGEEKCYILIYIWRNLVTRYRSHALVWTETDLIGTVWRNIFFTPKIESDPFTADCPAKSQILRQSLSQVRNMNYYTIEMPYCFMIICVWVHFCPSYWSKQGWLLTSLQVWSWLDARQDMNTDVESKRTKLCPTERTSCPTFSTKAYTFQLTITADRFNRLLITLNRTRLNQDTEAI